MVGVFDGNGVSVEVCVAVFEGVFVGNGVGPKLGVCSCVSW